MYQKPSDLSKVLTACGSSVSPCMLEKAIIMAGLTWGMPPAQVCAITCMALTNPVVFVQEVKENSVLTKMPPTTNYMMGIPIEIDKDLPSSVIQLRWKGTVIFTIESLSIPTGFENTPA